MNCSGCLTCTTRSSCFRISDTGRGLEKFMKYGGTLAFFIGSLCFALTTWAGTVPWIFAVFFLGHGCWLAAGAVMKDRGTIVLNAMYLVFDALAFVIRL